MLYEMTPSFNNLIILFYQKVISCYSRLSCSLTLLDFSVTSKSHVLGTKQVFHTENGRWYSRWQYWSPIFM